MCNKGMPDCGKCHCSYSKQYNNHSYDDYQETIILRKKDGTLAAPPKDIYKCSKGCGAYQR